MMLSWSSSEGAALNFMWCLSLIVKTCKWWDFLFEVSWHLTFFLSEILIICCITLQREKESGKDLEITSTWYRKRQLCNWTTIWPLLSENGYMSITHTHMPTHTHTHTHTHIYNGLPRWFSDKESICLTGDMKDLIPGLGRPPGEGNGIPLQYSCLVSPMNRGAWQATVHGVSRVWHDLLTRQQQNEI